MIPEIKNILYATDLTKNSSYAFFYAIDMAKRHGASIVILHAVEPIRPYLYSDVAIGIDAGVYETLEKEKKEQQKTDSEEIKKHLQVFCRKAETQIGPPCVELVSKILVPIGHPVEEILKAADEEGCDAIVLGTHGKGLLKHTFLGSVSNGVLHRTRKPVFIVPLPSKKTNIDWDNI